MIHTFGKNDTGNGKGEPSFIGRSIPRKYLLVCLLGLVIFSAGLLMATSSQLLKDYNSSRSYYHFQPTEDSFSVRTCGVMVAELGTMIASAGFLAAGFRSEELNWQTRSALLGSCLGLYMFMLFFLLIYGLT